MAVDGLDAAGDALWSFLTSLIEDGFTPIRDNLVEGLWNGIVIKIFGTAGLDVKDVFLLFLIASGLIFCIKFVYLPLMRSG